MSKYALVENGVVTNIIVWEGPEVSPIDWPEGTEAVWFDDKVTFVDIGYLYADGEFTNPNPPEPGPETGESSEVIE